MLPEELRQAQERATIPAEEKNTYHNARSRSKESVSQSNLQITSTTTMEERQYGKIIDSIPTLSG